MIATATDVIDFELPDALAAGEPSEARGLPRDGVRLMVSGTQDDGIVHGTFRDLPARLAAGDVLVVNRSATLNAAFDAHLERGDGSHESIVVHVSTVLSRDEWVIELRRRAGDSTVPLADAAAGQRVRLPSERSCTLVRPFAADQRASTRGVRLWVVRVSEGLPMPSWGELHGRPIRYGYVPREWPLRFYQTIFATEPGSAEMPSAGRPFTQRLVDDIEGRGIVIAGLVLHAGVASQESDELPAPERYRVPATTAALVNGAHRRGRRVIGVGTTVLRALETVTTADGIVHPGSGWTNLVVTPDHRVRSVNGLLTGLHAPRASHLWMLEAFAGARHLALAYDEALRNHYLWHEFGDMHLLLRQ